MKLILLTLKNVVACLDTEIDKASIVKFIKQHPMIDSTHKLTHIKCNDAFLMSCMHPEKHLFAK